MNNRGNSKPNLYQQLLEKLDEVTERKRQSEESSPTSHPSPRVLWTALHPSPPPTVGCPHCPHCISPLTPLFPQTPQNSLLTSLTMCQTELQFINAIVWMKSLVTASPEVPITQVKRILKALVEIEENTPPRLSSKPEAPREPSQSITTAPQPPLMPPTITMVLEEAPAPQESSKGPGDHEKLKELSSSDGKKNQEESGSSGDQTKKRIRERITPELPPDPRESSKGLQEHEKWEETSGNPTKKRKLEENDSAVVLSQSPERTWDSYNQELPQDLARKTLIPDTDEEASQMTPDMSFGESFDGNPWVKDSGLEGESQPLPSALGDNGSLENCLQDVVAVLEEIEQEEEEVISSVGLAGILREFPIISVALSIVRSTLRALEAEDTVEYCWREGGIVERAVRVILGFIDTVAIEEYKYPGYLDFFVKCSVETVINVIEGNAQRDHVDVRRHHHLKTVLELCNCRLICEEIISYLFKSLSKLSNESAGEESPLVVSTESKKCLILEILHVTMEKFVEIVGSNLPQSSLDFFHVEIVNPAEKLISSWESHLNEFAEKNLEISPFKVSFLKNLFQKFKTRLTEHKVQ